MTALPDNDELAAMLDKATPGPWRVVPVKGYTDDQIVTDHPDYQQKPHGNYIGETGLAAGHARQNFSNDSALMVLSRELAEEVIRLRAGLTVQEAAKVLLGDDIAISKMAEAIHDGPLGADDYWFSAARPQGAWCVEVVRAALRALAGDLS